MKMRRRLILLLEDMEWIWLMIFTPGWIQLAIILSLCFIAISLRPPAPARRDPRAWPASAAVGDSVRAAVLKAQQERSALRGDADAEEQLAKREIMSKAYIVGRTMARSGAVKPDASQIDALSRAAQAQAGDTHTLEWFKQHFETGFGDGYKSD